MKIGPALALVALIGIAGVGGWKLSRETSRVHRYEAHNVGTESSTDSLLYHFWKWFTHDQVAFFTLLLAAFTFALVSVSIVRIRFLIRADRTTRISADAATVANDNATKSLYSSQRPWVVADNLGLSEPITFSPGHHEIHAFIDLKNTGQSLANKVQMWVRLCSMSGATLGQSWQTIVNDFHHHLEVVHAELWPVGIVLAPGQTIRQPFAWGGPVAFDSPTEQDIRGGAFLLLGYLEYTDQFDLRHRTRFAFHPDADSVHPWNPDTFRVAGAYQEAT
jgi:hypothetical protein